MRKTMMNGSDLFLRLVELIKESGNWPKHIHYAIGNDMKRVPEGGKFYSDEFTVYYKLGYGGSEGIYLDIYVEGYYSSDVDSVCRMDIGTVKTLDTSSEAFYDMAKLGADFVLQSRQFLRDHGDDFTWQGWGVFRTGNVLRGIYCPTEDRVLEYAKDWEDAGCVDILVKNFSSREVFTYHRGVCTPVEEDVCADE